MKPNPEFVKLPKSFWAAVRTVSQQCGYTLRGEGSVKVPTREEIKKAFENLGLSAEGLNHKIGDHDLLEVLWRYFDHRARTLNHEVEPLLMDAVQAKLLFEKLKKEIEPKCPLPMNKQKGAMKAPAYLTAL